jgi:hypothetical protein
MAKKRASSKPRGTDAGGNPIDLSSNSQYQAEMRRFNNAKTERDKLLYPYPNRAASQQAKVAARNILDFDKNYFPSDKSQKSGRNIEPRTFAMPKADTLSGRTVEFGTRSVLEGIKSWMRGGGGFRQHGR